MTPVEKHEGQLLKADWLSSGSTKAVFDALTSAGHVARAVGGATRDTLAGLPVKDVDLATTAKPEQIIDAAERAGLKCIPTGLDHGTITVLFEDQPFEVTTLRKDVSTDGRRATVAFTSDWVLDAERRDFTINAIYVDADGTIFDPVGGVADLANKRVRFIGDARQRIQEDYLRVLRFFRFESVFGLGNPDANAISACQQERAGLARLSGERVRAELLRLLETPRAARMVAEMDAIDVFEPLLEQTVNVAALACLISLEDQIGIESEVMRRLSILLLKDARDVASISSRLRLSGVERNRLQSIATHLNSVPASAATDSDMKRRLYELGVEAFQDTEFIAWAMAGDPPGASWRRQRLTLPQRWEIPRLPIGGGDFVAAGVSPGPAVGELMREFELWWIEAGFPDDGEQIAVKISNLVEGYQVLS